MGCFGDGPVLGTAADDITNGLSDPDDVTIDLKKLVNVIDVRDDVTDVNWSSGSVTNADVDGPPPLEMGASEV